MSPKGIYCEILDSRFVPRRKAGRDESMQEQQAMASHRSPGICVTREGEGSVLSWELGSHIIHLTVAQQIEYNQLDTTVNTLYGP